MAVSKGFAIGQVETRPFGLQMVDLANGNKTRIATLDPAAAGTGWLSADLPWVIWQQSESPYNGADWSVHAWNQTTGVEQVLAVSRLGDGTFVYGQMPFPVVRQGVAFWAQPLPRKTQAPQAELRMVDLASGKTSILDTGSISSPVLAGSSLLIWGRSENDGRYSFKAVDVATQRPVELPQRLRSYGSTIGYLAGSPDYLVWNGAGTVNQELNFWKVGTADFYHATFDASHFVQFMQNAGHFLLWYTGTKSVVFDLDSGYGFDTQGALAGSRDAIVQTSGSQLFWTATDSAPAISGCHPE